MGGLDMRFKPLFFFFSVDGWSCAWHRYHSFANPCRVCEDESEAEPSGSEFVGLLNASDSDKESDK